MSSKYFYLFIYLVSTCREKKQKPEKFTDLLALRYFVLIFLCFTLQIWCICFNVTFKWKYLIFATQLSPCQAIDTEAFTSKDQRSFFLLSYLFCFIEFSVCVCVLVYKIFICLIFFVDFVCVCILRITAGRSV